MFPYASFTTQGAAEGHSVLRAAPQNVKNPAHNCDISPCTERSTALAADIITKAGAQTGVASCCCQHLAKIGEIARAGILRTTAQGAAEWRAVLRATLEDLQYGSYDIDFGAGAARSFTHAAYIIAEAGAQSGVAPCCRQYLAQIGEISLAHVNRLAGYINIIKGKLGVDTTLAITDPEPTVVPPARAPTILTYPAFLLVVIAHHADGVIASKGGVGSLAVYPS